MNEALTPEPQAFTDAPHVHHFGRVRADELPVPFYAFAMLTATDVDGQEHVFYVPTAALDAARASASPGDDRLREALIAFWDGCSEFEWAAMDGAEFASLVLAALAPAASREGAR